MNKQIEITEINDVVKKVQPSITEFMTFRQGAKYLGLSSSTLYKLTSANKITYWKPGGKLVYFRKEDLDKYLWQNKICSESEIAETASRHVSESKRQKDKVNG
jgi:excisionase family DNA binding protein